MFDYTVDVDRRSRDKVSIENFGSGKREIDKARADKVKMNLAKGWQAQN